MIPKKPAPDLIRGGYRFSEKITLHRKAMTTRNLCLCSMVHHPPRLLQRSRSNIRPLAVSSDACWQRCVVGRGTPTDAMECGRGPCAPDPQAPHGSSRPPVRPCVRLPPYVIAGPGPIVEFCII